jgi:hypothetical protein
MLAAGRSALAGGACAPVEQDTHANSVRANRLIRNMVTRKRPDPARVNPYSVKSRYGRESLMILDRTRVGQWPRTPPRMSPFPAVASNKACPLVTCRLILAGLVGDPPLWVRHLHLRQRRGARRRSRRARPPSRGLGSYDALWPPRCHPRGIGGTPLARHQRKTSRLRRPSEFCPASFLQRPRPPGIQWVRIGHSKRSADLTDPDHPENLT